VYLTRSALGAGCGLTAIALLKKGFRVIATDKASALDILDENVNTFLASEAALHHRLVDKIGEEMLFLNRIPVTTVFFVVQTLYMTRKICFYICYSK
jgi:predicted RNA methylase